MSGHIEWKEVQAWAETFYEQLLRHPTVPDTSKVSFLREMLFLLTLPKSDEDMLAALDETKKALRTFHLVRERLAQINQSAQKAMGPDALRHGAHSRRIKPSIDD